jgi:hypothetical protein
MTSRDLTRRLSPAVVLVLALVFSGAANTQEKAPSAALPELGKIAKKYQIEIITADPHFPVKTTYGKIDGKSADRKELESYAGLFAPEFTLYPPSLVARTTLKRIVFCSELSFAGQRRNAIPDFEHDTLYLDVSRGSYSKPYLRTVIHHEYFHIIDYRFHLSVYKDDGNLYKDDRWDALKPKDFKYGSGGKNAQDISTTSVLTDKYPGFLNHYSTTAVEEDKAEIFAHLIVDPAHVEERAKKDRVIKAKVDRMKEVLVSFCPDMNDEFWKKARALKRAE